MEAVRGQRSNSSGGAGLLKRVFAAVVSAFSDARWPELRQRLQHHSAEAQVRASEENGARILDVVQLDETLSQLIGTHPHRVNLVGAALDRFSHSEDNSGLDYDSSNVAPILTVDRQSLHRAPFSLRLRALVESFFLAKNWERDLRLQNLAFSHSGVVPIEILARFRRVREMLDVKSAGPETIASACRGSHVVAVVNDDSSTAPDDTMSSLGALRRLTLPERVSLLFQGILSSRSVSRNPFLLRMIEERADGLLPLSELLRLPQVRAVVFQQEDAVASVLQQFSEIDVVKEQPRGNYMVRLPDQRAMLATVSTGAAVAKTEPPGDQELYARTDMPLLTRRVVDMPASTNGSQPNSSFSVMTFNVLCQMYTPYHTYAHVQHLEYGYRRHLLLKLVERHGADILCLQELQGKHWKMKKEGDVASEHHDMAGDILPDLAKLGFFNQYARASTAKEIDLGNALLWRTSVFHKVSHRIISLADEVRKRCGDDEATIEHFVHKQTALIVRLQHRDSGQELCVCTTHIACAYENVEIQLAQVMILLQALWTASDLGTLPVIFAGDFNALPIGEVYTLLTEGELDDGDVQREMPADVIFPTLRRDKDTGFLGHALNLESAYRAVLGREPETTNATPDFSGCLDYIFYSRDKLNVQSVRKLPLQAELVSDGGGLPNSVWPSDHLPLVSTLSFAPGGEKRCPSCGKRIEVLLPDEIVLVHGQEAHAGCYPPA